MDYLLLTSDYMEGCHPAILERMTTANMEQHAGYGADEICESARARIRTTCEAPHADVYFLVGGTQTNAVVLDALLLPWEGVVAAATGHIATHEAGAVEHTGHKVIEVPENVGKLEAASVRDVAATWAADENRAHMIQPGVVYVSQPTEFGTLYSRAELEDLRAVCDEYGMRLYVDGARLAYALACDANDVGLPDLARLADAFYIGGTKCGALLGEAVVFPNPHTCPRFFTLTKQRGALLAKGWLLGIQFDTLFEDDLYLRVGKPAIEAADKIRELLAKHGYELVFGSPTNQVFVVLEDTVTKRLAQRVGYSFWQKTDATHTLVRFATSWATSLDDVLHLATLLDDMTRTDGPGSAVGPGHIV